MNFQNPKFVLIAIALLFFTPLLLAVLMRSEWWDFKPENLSNRGQLVQPPVPVAPGTAEIQYIKNPGANSPEGQWVILYPFSGQCEVTCQQTITSLRQVHLATGRHQENVAIWLLSPHRITSETQQSLVAIYPRFEIRFDQNQQIFSLLRQIDNAADLQYGQAYLLDPAANIILRYPPGFDPGDINQDLDRLLAWSGKD